MSSKVFYLVISSFITGVFFRFLFDLGLSFLVLILLVAFVVFIYNKRLLYASVALIILALGMLRADFSLERDGYLDEFIRTEINVRGIISAEPTNTVKSSRLILTPEGTKEKILVVTEKTNLFKYGQEVLAKGLLESPENFITKNEREFDYISYLSKDRIFYEMVFPEIEIINKPSFSIKGSLLSFKTFLISKINKAISSPESEYVGGLLFGVKESLGKELEESFRKTGLIHVVVLSGYNVTIVADSIIKSLSVFSLGLSSFVGALSIILFAVMTGASATIVRASIMALIVVFSKFISRRYSINRALALAGFLMILHNPKILLHDPSFQLSFLATVGLIHLSPLIYRKLSFIPNKFQIRTLLSSTLATQIFVLPLLLNMVGEISLVAPLTNILVLPLIPLSMFMGFLTSIVGIFSTTISLLPGAIAFVLLTYQLKVVEVFSSLPFASIKGVFFPIWIVVLFYLGILFIFVRRLQRGSQQTPS